MTDMEDIDNIAMEGSTCRECLWERFVNLFNSIDARHAAVEKSIYNETTEEEQEALGILDSLIGEGDHSLYPLKALLSASNNWHTTVIVRMSQFRDILLEGIEKGCLSPDDEEGWSWLLTATESNDPAEFMTDVDRFYNLLADAMEAGNQDAREIMDMIWEPEQIIEED